MFVETLYITKLIMKTVKYQLKTGKYMLTFLIRHNIAVNLAVVHVK